MRALRAPIVIAAVTILTLASAGQAAAKTRVRFLHAVPGAGDATLTVSGGSGPGVSIKGVGFGEASDTAPAPSGDVTITLDVGGKQAAKSTQTLASGSYTIVAEPGGGGKVRLIPYRAGKAKAGAARVRAVHGAAELPRADFSAGDTKLGSLERGDAGEYATVDPGAYAISAMRPGSDDAVVERKGVNLAAGTASTAYAIGSGGARARFVVVQDDVDAPSRGPATGLGGLSSGDSPWFAALLAALSAGALGGLLYTRVARGRDTNT